jgi:hypothetical protein
LPWRGSFFLAVSVGDLKETAQRGVALRPHKVVPLGEVIPGTADNPQWSIRFLDMLICNVRILRSFGPGKIRNVLRFAARGAAWLTLHLHDPQNCVIRSLPRQRLCKLLRKGFG